MTLNTLAIIIGISFAWSLAGFFIYLAYEQNSIIYNPYQEPTFAYLNPVWLYKNYRVNFFGVFLLTFLFNLLCPLVSVIYWSCKFVKWICTVGRK